MTITGGRRLLEGEAGVSLLELLIAVIMVCTVVGMMALLIPKSSKVITNNRYHWYASNLATTQMQALKQTPYARLTPTGAGQPPSVLNTYFPISGSGVGGCDCGKEDLSGVPGDPGGSFTDNSMTYTRKTCINLIDQTAGVWKSYCPDPANFLLTDKGLKHIRVQVSWTNGLDQSHVDMENSATR